MLARTLVGAVLVTACAHPTPTIALHSRPNLNRGVVRVMPRGAVRVAPPLDSRADICAARIIRDPSRVWYVRCGS